MKIQGFLIFSTLMMNIENGVCICYFPGELQGVWATQKSIATSFRGTRSPISYQEVTIEAAMILQWGMCHSRGDNNIILKDNTGATSCYRCIYMNVASPRVVQVWTMGLETCYTSEEAALSTCPPMQAIAAKRAREIMLYKIRSAWGDPEVREVECPLNGRFTFTYRRGHNGASSTFCNQPTSEFSNCPYGIGFNVLYKDCSFASPLRSGLQCLGSWVGEDDEDYLAVIDTSVKDGDDSPKFKCGMFHEEVGTGRVFLAFSEDSTCTNSLKSPRDGYETYEMMSSPPQPLPPFVSQATCKFPKSLMGHWHHTYVADDTVVFKDYRNFKTYSARCVSDMNDGERYIVYAQTHCGDWSYNCLWLKRRSANVLEFMLGLYPRETFDDLLCEVDKFGDMTSWTTQGKSLLEEPTTCPIVGNYMGVLPDANGICAQLYSDCSNPQIMFYTVSDCSNLSAIYERGDLPGPTSEAGPWVPPEQKVSTGAVLTIVDDTHRRGRRQVSNGQLRVANALTTTISWLWGSSTTLETTTTTSETTTTTTTATTTRPYSAPEWRRPQPPLPDNPLQNRDFDRRVNHHLFPESRYHQSNTPIPEPQNENRHNVGFWPRNRNEQEYSLERNSSPSPITTSLPVLMPGPIREINSELDHGVPGRATWVPGSPPGFNSQGPGKEEPSIHQGSHVHSSLASQASITRDIGDSSSLASSNANRQPLKQEREYQCLGQWEEEGRIYALTYRRDIQTYECFVGIIRSNGVVFIKEAGTECSRGVQPEVLGMKLHRKGAACPQSAPTSPQSAPSSQASKTISSQGNKSSPREETKPRTMQPPWLRTTRPWKPITAALRVENQVVLCKVGTACKSVGSKESVHDKFHFIMRQNYQRKIHQSPIPIENGLMERISNSIRSESSKGIRNIQESVKIMLKRLKRDTIENTSVLENSEDDQHEKNKRGFHNTTISDTFTEQSFHGWNHDNGNPKKESLCDPSCPQNDDNEGQTEIMGFSEIEKGWNKDTITPNPSADHLNVTSDFPNNRLASVSLYSENKNNDSYKDFENIPFSLYMANNSESHNHSQTLDIKISFLYNESLSHQHKPNHSLMDVHEDDTSKATHSVKYLSPYSAFFSRATDKGNDTVHIKPRDHESLHNYDEDLASNIYNLGDTHDSGISHDDHQFHNEKQNLSHGHGNETDDIHPQRDKLEIREDHSHENMKMYDYEGKSNYGNGHTKLDSHTYIDDYFSRTGHIHNDDQVRKDEDDDPKKLHSTFMDYEHAYGQDLTSDDQSHVQYQKYRAVPFANKSSHTSANHTVEVENRKHEGMHNKFVMSQQDTFPILLQIEDILDDYQQSMMDHNVTNICNDTGLDSMSFTQNKTYVFQVANCSDDWMDFENGTTEMIMDTTTEDSDIPKIPISLLEYPTVQPTTAKPSLVTLPPMIWQPFAQPGRPRHRGSGSTGICKSSEPLIIGLITFLSIFSNRV